MDDLLGTKRVREFEKAKGDIRRALTEKYVEPHDRDLMGAELMRLGSFVAPSGLIGLGFGIILASRRRSRRNAALNVLLAHEKPVVVGFANGRTGEWCRDFMKFFGFLVFFFFFLFYSRFEALHLREQSSRLKIETYI